MVGEITRFLAYEALRDLGTVEVVIDTPVADGVVARQVNENILVVPVLRAGLGMVQAIQEVVPLTEVAHVGLRRDEATLRSEVYLNRLPRQLDGRRVLVCDPMLATGRLARPGVRHGAGAGRERGDRPVHHRVGARHRRLSWPPIPPSGWSAPPWIPQLNDVGYIVPGLGDAGDRLFGPPD